MSERSDGYDDADVSELLRWFDVSVRGVLAHYGGSQAEFELLQAPGGLERLAEENELTLAEALEKMGFASKEQFLAAGREDVKRLQVEIGTLERALASVEDDPPWSLWVETFGTLPTPGLLPVHLEVVADKAEWPSLLHFHALNQRSDFLGAYALGRALLIDPSAEYTREFTRWMLGVAQRRGLLLDERRRLSFMALSSHSAVREEALQHFVSEQRFVTETEWNAFVDAAVIEARKEHLLDTGEASDAAFLQATHGVVAELLQLSLRTCEGMYQAFLAQEKPRPRCR